MVDTHGYRCHLLQTINAMSVRKESLELIEQRWFSQQSTERA
jgi:hypothetical protein